MNDFDEAFKKAESIMRKLGDSFTQMKRHDAARSNKLVDEAEVLLAGFSRKEYPVLVEMDHMRVYIRTFLKLLDGKPTLSEFSKEAN